MRTARMLGLVFASLLALLVLATVTGCASSGSDTYKIGALFDVNGFNSPLGTPERDTALMLEKQINDAGLSLRNGERRFIRPCHGPEVDVGVSDGVEFAVEHADRTSKRSF